MLRPGIAILAFSLFVLAGCGGSDETLTLRGDGTPERIEVSYRVSDGDRVTEMVQSPWQLDVQVNGDWSIDLRVKNPGKSGHVTCSFGGDAIERAVGTDGEASAHCSAAKSGDTTEYDAEGEEFSAAVVRGTGPADPPPP